MVSQIGKVIWDELEYMRGTEVGQRGMGPIDARQTGKFEWDKGRYEKLE